MKLAQIEGGMVANVIAVDPDNIPDWARDWPVLADDAGPGWAYDGQAFAPPVQADPDPADVLAARRASARLWRGDFCNGLADLSILTDDDAIAAARGEWPASMEYFLGYLTAAQARAARIEWASCANVERMHWLILSMISVGVVTEAQADQLFGIVAGA